MAAEDDRTTADDIALAYRLVLNREPDPGGLRHYTALASEGLSFRALVDALLRSTEYRERTASDDPAPIVREGSIEPGAILARFTVEEFAETADAYYRSVTDPTPLMVRPFAYLHEAPVMLQSLGMLLAGLQLGKTMRVLDFGAGACWLSRSLAQLGCEPVCCDVSAAALQIGRRLFAEHPPIGPNTATPAFVQFDGRRLPLDAESVDRIVCFDAFHHVPNPADILAEFGRVLRPGGIAGFSEPGRHHSQSPQAQSEMRDRRVLENDIDLHAIFTAAHGAGFTNISVRVPNDLEISLAEYDAMVAKRRGQVELALWRNACDAITDRTVFFLHKGQAHRDSRSHVGLAHTMELRSVEKRSARDAALTINLVVTNTGDATWLRANAPPVGVVRVGTHLYDRHDALIAWDHSRHELPRDVQPGESIALAIEVPLPAGDAFVVGIDLVAEGVMWFEHAGSTPLRLGAR